MTAKTETLYDPPSGWRYGFPKPYKPWPGECIEETLLRDGYPQTAIDKYGATCNFFEDEDFLELAQATFAPLEEITEPTMTDEEVEEIWQWATEPAATNDNRRGDFMQTYTGRKFFPLDPRADEVDIGDIAHSLSMQCRYAGHGKRFYSVAEHSTLMARWLRGRYGAEIALWGLLHDASEAYLVDVPRPVKPYLAGYKDAEARVQEAIAKHFGLSLVIPPEVHEADRRIIGDEIVNMHPMEWHRRYDDPLGVPIMYWSPAEAEEEFMNTFDALMAQVKMGRAA